MNVFINLLVKWTFSFIIHLISKIVVYFCTTCIKNIFLYGAEIPYVAACILFAV
jgi:hypothetical protein